ncbi:hypothetical protein WR25_26181 isoform C [Diploscapter pachys]|uniref:Metalloendopeptidase n=1 Tax=Diploscapter pachys TaxID=2018661 RepID=A0A2A2KWB3_9BILA|nr:hypothetical protein WR25_26181 isoform B [Diploscapter pachys]PAV78168.1 hypothetical protein WR25_26181 isoform C [Diploscapter pachys]
MRIFYVLFILETFSSVQSQIDLAKLLAETGFEVPDELKNASPGTIRLQANAINVRNFPTTTTTTTTSAPENSGGDDSSTPDPHSYMTPEEVMQMQANGKGLKGMSTSELKALMGNCAGNDDCKKQKSEHRICKETLIKMTTEYLSKVHGRDMSKDVRRQFDKIYQYKLALVNKAGLEESLVPADNGVIDGDIILTEEQAEYMLSTVNPDGNYRSKRNALFVDGNGVIKKWDASRPIPYSFNENINEEEKELIQKGIRMIESAGTCVRFVHRPFARGYFIHFVKMDNINACGFTNIGRIANGTQVQLSFTCPDMEGVIAHEIMHALGIHHMHQRMDRERYLEINWKNVNPQLIDQYTVVDQKLYTTYGVPYDFESIMHYKSTFASRIFNKDVMVPRRNHSKKSLLGQRKRLTASDVELINKMYCMNTTTNTYVDFYMEPSPMSSKQGFQQLDEFYTGITTHGIHLGYVNLVVAWPEKWSSDINTNINFINSVVTRANQYMRYVYILTNEAYWTAITGNWKPTGNYAGIWWMDVSGDGQSGESQPDFKDFQSFGPWTSVSTKQFARNETVCGVTGKEKTVILISTVRSNEEGKVGFLSNWRRANVTITRAKAALIIFDNHKTLAANQNWNQLLRHYKPFMVEGSRFNLRPTSVELEEPKQETATDVKSMKIDEAGAPKKDLKPLKEKFNTAEDFMNNVYPMISAERAAQRKKAEESKTIGRIVEVGSNFKGQHTLTFTLSSIFFKEWFDLINFI